VGQWSIHWYSVQQLLEKDMRVCSYDRAGYGWSYPIPKAPSAEQAAQDLHKLLAVSGERGPFVFAGHSYAGYVIRLFASLLSAGNSFAWFYEPKEENAKLRMLLTILWLNSLVKLLTQFVRP
ncbi:alpha/beta hydrolase, partial [bacterium]|nr:alpha/beta hydrolase [bacterium]